MDAIIMMYVSLTQKQYDLNFTLKRRKINCFNTLPAYNDYSLVGQLIQFKLGLYNNSKYSVSN